MVQVPEEGLGRGRSRKYRRGAAMSRGRLSGLAAGLRAKQQAAGIDGRQVVTLDLRTRLLTHTPSRQYERVNFVVIWPVGLQPRKTSR
jgi:hypothetical protein